MPIGEIEYHSFLTIGESIKGNKMILGTFPIYSLTNPRTIRKDQQQLKRGDISFFYGSQANCFWDWYQHYVDSSVNIQSPQSLITSLRNKGITISDVIKQCTRINESFEDSKLKNKVWNEQLGTIIEHRIDKIICTSKSDSGTMGWLRDKILQPNGFTVDQSESFQLHKNILNKIPDSNINVKEIAQVFVKRQKKVSIIALPSPGSPGRRLINFGFNKGVYTTSQYLKNYLQVSFNWFNL